MIALRPAPPRPLLGQRQERLALEPTPCLPRGFRIEDEPAGLQLIRDRDGARLGVMATFDLACDYASALARIDAQRSDREEAA